MCRQYTSSVENILRRAVDYRSELTQSSLPDPEPISEVSMCSQASNGKQPRFRVIQNLSTNHTNNQTEIKKQSWDKCDRVVGRIG